MLLRERKEKEALLKYIISLETNKNSAESSTVISKITTRNKMKKSEKFNGAPAPSFTKAMLVLPQEKETVNLDKFFSK